MLTAYENAAGDDLVYETRADVRAGHLVQTDRTWSWPAVPSPGQVQYERDVQRHSAGGIQATASVKLTEDRLHHRHPPPSVYGQRSPPPHHRLLRRDRPDRLGWGRRHPGGNLVEAHRSHAVHRLHPLAREPTSPGRSPGQWRIVGHTRLRGQRAMS